MNKLMLGYDFAKASLIFDGIGSLIFNVNNGDTKSL